MSLKTKLKQLREHLGISICELSRQTGISKSYLWKIENEYSHPSRVKLLIIERALGATYGYLDDDLDISDGTDSQMLAESILNMSEDDKIRVKQIVKLWSKQ